MRRIMAGIAFVCFSVAWSGGALSQDATRAQHRVWMRKLHTPGGTLPESLHAIIGSEASEPPVPGGTAAQHRSWIRKHEISGELGSLPL